MSEPRVLVWGAGAIGAVAATVLKRAGADVRVVDRNQAHVDAINAQGLALQGTMPVTEALRADTPDTVEGQFDIIFLAVKAQATADATQELAPHLASDGFVVSLQNGLNERVIAEHIGQHRVIGSLINQFYADYLEPGLVSYQGNGIVVLGELDARKTERVAAVAAALGELRVTVADDIWAYKWGKLAWGALLVATAIEGIPMADALVDEALLPLHLTLMQEVVAVAASQNVLLATFPGFDGGAAARAGTREELAAILRDSSAALRETNKKYSGIWRDLAVHHRKTEVHAQYAPVLTAAQHAGIAIPVLAGLVQTVGKVENGEVALGPESIEYWRSVCASS